MGVVGVVPTTVGGSRVSARRVRLAVALVLLNVLDVVLTRLVLDRGGIEANPTMQSLMDGFAAPLGIKVAVSALAGGLLLCCPERSRLADNAVRFMVGVYALIALWNLSLLGWLQFS